MSDHRYLTRKEASAWFQAKGLRHVTVSHLSDLADAGRGPPYSRMGKYVYYTETDLRAWLATAMQPSTRFRTQASTAA
jgi:hypothetical protein